MARIFARLQAIALALALALMAVAASGSDGDPADFLEIEIRDDAETAARVVRLDRATLAGLPQTEFTTTTIWTEGPQHFRGVALSALLAHLRLEAQELDLIAVNDYMVTLPADAVGPDYPVIAHERNGAPMGLRDKGPFWLVYDYDADPAFRTEITYVRSIWQLTRIIAYPAKP
jgi:hypothetical protein